MKRFQALSFAFLFLALFSAAQQGDLSPGPAIIPAPQSLQVVPGQFVFSSESAILFENSEDQRIAQLFHDFLKDNYSLDIPVAKNFIKAPEGLIRFSSAEYGGANPEGYNLTVNPGQIEVSGKSAGLFYGFQTLIQLFPVEKGTVLQIPCVKIADEPRYKYRGMHLDVARHMFPVSFIKKYIDILAQYKLNTFHWHLTDDQGWRIEIKTYPKLTEVGAFRAQTLIGNYHDRMPQWFDGTPYGGFYTQEEIKDIVAYAGSKFITVIPEIEMPGHSLAALAAYPELGCGDNPGPFRTRETWGISEDVFCAGKDSTFTFLENVLTEVMDLFPGTYIHIGGDECPKTRWHLCPYCQKRMRDNNLKNEDQLQSYFIHRVEKFLNSRGRQIIGWDEILQGGLAPNATVMSWRGTQGGIAAAKQNHDVVMTPGTYLYFDHLQGNATQEPLSIGGFLPLQQVYSYNPTPTALTAQQQTHIIGVQANLWTEYITTPEKVEYMIFPRIYALSEIAWTAPEQKDFTNFSELRVPVHLARLDKTKTLYRVPVAIGAKDTTMAGSEFSIALKPPVAGARIYYTIDGYEPRETENLYDKPLQISVPEGQKRVVKTIVITPSGKRSAITTTTLANMLPLLPATVTGQQAGLKYYFIPGDFELTDQIDTADANDKGITSEISVTRFRNRARTFGLVFTGYINIPDDGTYTFATSSDDGSQLWIDDNLVVDNDEKHASYELSSSVNLLKGFHKITVRYFQAGGGSELRVYMSQQGKTRTEIPSSMLFN